MFSRKKEKEPKEKKKEIIKETLSVLPIRNYDEGIDAFSLEDGTYLDLLEIVTRDRENLQDDVVRFDMFTLTKFERLYSGDHKIVGLNFPINTLSQRKYLDRKLKKTADPIRKEWLMRVWDELDRLESMIDRKEFYLFFFGKTKDELEKNRGNILGWIGYGSSKLVKPMGKEKKIQIIRKLCNMNALILADDLVEDDEYE